MFSPYVLYFHLFLRVFGLSSTEEESIPLLLSICNIAVGNKDTRVSMSGV